MNLDAYMARYLAPLEQKMQRVFACMPAGPAAYGQMLRYHLGWINEDGRPCGNALEHKTRGKRVRSILLLLCAEAAGGDPPDAMPAAAAVELLHNFSLIHDDIQDQSAKRRGRATVWAVWGTAQAINAGDAMYTLAYMALYRLAKRGLSPGRVLEAVRLFSDTCLALTMGQHMDIDFERRADVSTDAYLKMIGAKSEALIAASAELGAFCAGARSEIRQHYADFGRNLGLAFQIRDDILGIWGDEQHTGKPANSDIISRKKTLPVIYALGRSQALRDLYAQPEFSPTNVGQATMLIDETDARTYAENQESRAHSAALMALMAASPAPEPAEALNDLASRLLRRDR